MTNPDPDETELASPLEVINGVLRPTLNEMQEQIFRILSIIQRSNDEYNPGVVHEVNDHIEMLVRAIEYLPYVLTAYHNVLGPCVECGVPEPLVGTAYRIPATPRAKLVYPTDCPTCGLYIQCIDVMDHMGCEWDAPPDRISPRRDKELMYARPCGCIISNEVKARIQ